MLRLGEVATVSGSGRESPFMAGLQSYASREACETEIRSAVWSGLNQGRYPKLVTGGQRQGAAIAIHNSRHTLTWQGVVGLTSLCCVAVV